MIFLLVQDIYVWDVIVLLREQVVSQQLNEKISMNSEWGCFWSEVIMKCEEEDTVCEYKC